MTKTHAKAGLVRLPGPQQATWGERIEHLLEEVHEWCLGASRIIIEGPAWNQIYASFRLGQLCGAVELTVHRMGIPYEYVPPSTIKKFAVGNGRATKEQMVAAARVHLPRIKDHNMADAFFLAKWGYEKYGRGQASKASPA